MWPSRLLNAACVILATALTGYGAWSESWPATETSWTFGPDGNASARNKDVWLAWRERWAAAGNVPAVLSNQSVSGSVIFWTTNSYSNATVVYTNGGTVYTNSFTNISPVWVTNYYASSNATWPTNMGKYRIILPWAEPMGAGSFVEPWTKEQLGAYAQSNGLLPDLSFAGLSNYPAMIISNVVRRRQTGASTNGTVREYYTWLVPEYDTNGPVAIGAPVIYSGYMATNGWKDTHRPSQEGAVSTNPFVRFWSPLTSGPQGTFAVSGQYLDPTNYVFTNAIHAGLLASTNPIELDYPFSRITAITTTNAVTGTTCTVYYPTNATRTRVPLLANDVQRTTFNAEYYRAKQYVNVAFEAHPWVAVNGTYRSRTEGVFVGEGATANSMSAAMTAASNAIPATITTAFGNSDPVTNVYVSTNAYFETVHNDGATTNRNDFGGDPGTLAEASGFVQSEVAIDVLKTINYTAVTNTLLWDNGSLFGVPISNSYYAAAEDATVTGTNYHPWTGARVTVQRPGPDVVPRAFPIGNASNIFWMSVTDVPHSCDFFWSVTGDSNLTSIVSPMSYRQSAAESSVEYMKGAAAITAWFPQPSEVPTNAATRSWAIGAMKGVYRYNFTRP